MATKMLVCGVKQRRRPDLITVGLLRSRQQLVTLNIVCLRVSMFIDE